MNEETKSCINEIHKRIMNSGEVLGNGILKVDKFLNHQIDPIMMNLIGKYLGEIFKPLGVEKIVTAESSGIAPAFAVASYLGLPLVFARKKKPVTMKDTFNASAPSHTKGNMVTIHISKEFLKPNEKIVIIDDFLASGKTIDTLCKIVDQSGAEILGVAGIIEKSFENGRKLLEEKYKFPVYSVAKIASLENNTILIKK